MKSKRSAHLAVLIANLFYGANFTIAKIAMPAFIKPSAFIVLRVLFAAIFFELIWQIKKPTQTVHRADYFRFFLLGLFGVAINQLLFFEGLSRTSNINAALIMTSNPILVIFVAAFLIKERITWQRLGGILLGIAGAGLLIILRDPNGHATLLGDTMIFLNALSYAIYLVMLKPLIKKYDPVFLIRWTFLTGLLLVLPFGITNLIAVQWESFTTPVWFSVAYVIICTTILAYLFNSYGLQQLSPAVVSFYIYLQPVFATIMSVWMMHEKVSSNQVIACALIFSGIYLINAPGLVKAKS